MSPRINLIIAVVIFMLHQAFGFGWIFDYKIDGCVIYDPRDLKNYLTDVKASGYWSERWKPIYAIVPFTVHKPGSYRSDEHWCSASLSPQQMSSMDKNPQYLEIHFKKEISVSAIGFEPWDMESSPSKFRILGVKKSGNKKVLSNIKVSQAQEKYEIRFERGKFTKLRIEVFATAKNADYVTIGRIVLCP